MKIFFLGDFINNSGPSIANKMLRKGLGEDSNNHLFSDSRGKIGRIIEVIIKTYKADAICFCSYSKLNFLAIKITKILNKKTFYIMHGYKALENAINNEKANLIKIHDEEKFLFEKVDKIYCVSEKFMKYMKKAEPEYASKFDYNYNGLNLENIEKSMIRYNIQRNTKQIISVGGGMKLKNNLIICKVIEKLNLEKGMDLKFVVIGSAYTDKDEICGYNFVTYYDYLPHNKVIEIMAESQLYIQNSSFETFGLAVIEALIAGCNLIISDNVGAIGVLNTIESNDVIYDTMDIDEIAYKLEHVLINTNNERLREGMDLHQVLDTNSAMNLLSKIGIFLKGENI